MWHVDKQKGIIILYTWNRPFYNPISGIFHIIFLNSQIQQLFQCYSLIYLRNTKWFLNLYQKTLPFNDVLQAVSNICQSKLFGRCRRCDWNKVHDDHWQCIVKYHHCEGDHLFKNYRCSIITKFRDTLIDESRGRPDLLPHNVQLFVTVGIRNNDKNIINDVQINQTALSTPMTRISFNCLINP
jgi:hypothetical protein